MSYNNQAIVHVIEDKFLEYFDSTQDTLGQCADAMGVSTTIFYRIRKGRRAITGYMVHKLARHLGCRSSDISDIDDLMSYTEKGEQFRIHKLTERGLELMDPSKEVTPETEEMLIRQVRANQRMFKYLLKQLEILVESEEQVLASARRFGISYNRLRLSGSYLRSKEKLVQALREFEEKREDKEVSRQSTGK